MAERFTSELLRSLRNDLPIAWVIEVLGVAVKVSEGYVRFLCPRCHEFNTATKPATNLARCFRCQENFNAIELVMIVKRVNFVEAVRFLVELRDGSNRGHQSPPAT
jgi:DNA primase